MPDKKRILILCPYPQGVAAGQRLKYEQYIEEWESLGWRVDISPFIDTNTWEIAYKSGNFISKIIGVFKGHLRRINDLFRIRNYDIIYVFMYVTPFFTNLMERIVRIMSKKLIYDLEDNILIGQKLPKNSHPNPFSRIIKNRAKTNFLIINADHVITSSPFLNQICLERNKKKACTYITSSINTKLFRPNNNYTNDRVLTIGWTGTFSSKYCLDLLKTVFVRLSKKIDFKLIIIGNFEYYLPGVNLEVIKWTKKNEVTDLQKIDIGVYPLPINEWVLGKSGLKAIQYMAFGIPCIATKVGTTPLIIKDRVNGLLVKTEEEWENSLEELIKDPQLRKKLGTQARKDAIKNYSLASVGKIYTDTLDSVFKKTK